MFLRKIQLSDFRNYTRLELELEPGVCIFIGKNAQGKTNLLEAIGLLSTARSHRTNHDKDMIMLKKDRARARVECVERDGVHTVEMTLSRNERKRIAVNGLPVTRVGEMLGHIKTVAFAPEDLNIVKEGPAGRRRFIDIDLSQVKRTYFYHLSKYLKVLEQRNILLKDFAFGRGDETSLSVYDELLSEAAMPVLQERRAFVERLSPVCTAVHGSLSGDNEVLRAFYVPGADVQTPQEMLSLLQASRAGDIKRGLTGIGPHKDDMGLRLDDCDLRFYGSQGQQRTAALALKLAQLELMREDIGESPILLLDDVMSELDKDRQRHLLEHLENIQAIITTTHLLPELAAIKGAAVYEVTSGEIRKIQ